MIHDHGLGHRHLGNLHFHIFMSIFWKSERLQGSHVNSPMEAEDPFTYTADIFFAESLLGMSVTRKKPTQKSHTSLFPYKTKCMKRTLTSTRKSWVATSPCFYFSILYRNYVARIQVVIHDEHIEYICLDFYFLMSLH